MTLRYDCDGPDCAARMGDDVTRISVRVDEAPPELEEHDSDEFDEFTALPEIRITFGAFDELHFCSNACLTAWAMGQALDEREGAT